MAPQVDDVLIEGYPQSQVFGSTRHAPLRRCAPPSVRVTRLPLEALGSLGLMGTGERSVAPWPATDGSAQIRPGCAAMIPEQMYRPRPVPGRALARACGVRW